MPIYQKEINRLIEQTEVEEMLKRANSGEQQVCVVILYITGARPAEIVMLKRKDFEVIGEDLRITIVTKKMRGEMKRIIPFNITKTPFVDAILLPYLDTLDNPEEDIFSFKSPTRVRQIVYSLSNNELCPYNFRHNRLSRLGMKGASAHELMYFKGAKDLKSIAPYLYRNPSVLDRLKNQIE